MPSHLLPQPGKFCSAFDLPFLQAFLVVRPPCRGIGENPILVSREKRLRTPAQQDFSQPWIKRNLILRVFRLHIIHPATDNASLNQNGALLKIEVAPLQSENLADSKPQALRDQHHRAVWLAQMLEQFEELANFENPWALQPFACILHSHQRDRVLAEFDNAPPLRALEDKVHNSPYV